MSFNPSIYLDYNATSLITPEHIQKVADRYTQVQGNPSSIHASGRRAKAALEEARGNLAKILGCKHQEIIFTSGATESNNMVLRSTLLKNHRGNIVLSAGEHPSIKETCAFLAEHHNKQIVTAGLSADGRIDEQGLLDAVTTDTSLVAMIHVQNEIGVENPVWELASKIKAKHPHVHIHTDSVQALGKIDLRGLGTSAIDSASFSAHKIGGFHGIGALFLKQKAKIASLSTGGLQERGQRPGTENLPGIISFGMRAKDLLEAPQWLDGAKSLCTRLVDELKQLPRVRIHTKKEHSIGTSINLCIMGKDATSVVSVQEILLKLEAENICVSTGSACSSGTIKPRYVLKAMGLSDDISQNSIRISLGDGTKEEDIKKLLDVLHQIAKS